MLSRGGVWGSQMVRVVAARTMGLDGMATVGLASLALLQPIRMAADFHTRWTDMAIM